MLFLKDGAKVAGETGNGTLRETVIVQPKPLGYSEPSVRKFEQCSTPVIEVETGIPSVGNVTVSMSEPIAQTTDYPLEPAQSTTTLANIPLPVEHKKAPNLVITPPVL